VYPRQLLARHDRLQDLEEAGCVYAEEDEREGVEGRAGGGGSTDIYIYVCPHMLRMRNKEAKI
jgi:hypothetical protein